MKIFISIGFHAMALALIAGCASIISDSKYPVTISSEPLGAEITIRNRAGFTIFAGTTPTTVNLEAGAGYFKGANYTVIFNKEGYTSFSGQIARNIDGWYLGNFFLGGLIGFLIVDPATGAMWKLEDMHMDMVRLYSSLPKQGLHVVMLKDIPVPLRPKLIRVN